MARKFIPISVYTTAKAQDVAQRILEDMGYHESKAKAASRQLRMRLVDYSTATIVALFKQKPILKYDYVHNEIGFSGIEYEES